MYLSEQLQVLQGKYACLGDVRGCGLFQGIEFIRTPSPEVRIETPEEEPDEETAQRVVDFLQSINIISSRGRVYL